MASLISLTVIAVIGCAETESYRGQFSCPENPGEREGQRLVRRGRAVAAAQLVWQLDRLNQPYA